MPSLLTEGNYHKKKNSLWLIQILVYSVYQNLRFSTDALTFTAIIKLRHDSLIVLQLLCTVSSVDEYSFDPSVHTADLQTATKITLFQFFTLCNSLGSILKYTDNQLHTYILPSCMRHVQLKPLCGCSLVKVLQKCEKSPQAFIVLLVHNWQVLTAKNSLVCCLNHCPAVSCTWPSNMSIWSMRDICNDPKMGKSQSSDSKPYAWYLSTFHCMTFSWSCILWVTMGISSVMQQNNVVSDFTLTLFLDLSALLLKCWTVMVCTICVVMTEVQKQGSLNVLLLFAHTCYLLPEIPSLSCVECSYNQSQQDALFLKSILVKNSTSFRQTYCPSSGT